MPDPVVLTVDPLDAQLHYTQRLNWPNKGCTAPCWRRGGKEACTCDDYDQDGTTEGGW